MATREPRGGGRLVKALLAAGRFLVTERSRAAQITPITCACASCAGPSWPIALVHPEHGRAGETPLPSSLFPARLFQPTLTHVALLPSTARGRKEHLDLIKRLFPLHRDPGATSAAWFQPLPLGFSFSSGWRSSSAGRSGSPRGLNFAW